MSWDQATQELTQELMRQKVQDCIRETLETSNQASVTDLGKIDLITLEHWADITIKFAFKVLRRAKAISLVMDKNNLDKAQVDSAFAQLIKDRPNSLDNYRNGRYGFRN